MQNMNFSRLMLREGEDLSRSNNKVYREACARVREIRHESNRSVQSFNTVPPRRQTEDFLVVMRADKGSSNKRERRCNEPSVDEVSIFIVGEVTYGRKMIP